jgi:hypothetical protein
MVIGHRIPDPAMSLTKSAIRHFDPQRQVYVLGDAKPDRKTPLVRLQELARLVWLFAKDKPDHRQLLTPGEKSWVERRSPVRTHHDYPAPGFPSLA